MIYVFVCVFVCVCECVCACMCVCVCARTRVCGERVCARVRVVRASCVCASVDDACVSDVQNVTCTCEVQLCLLGSEYFLST